MLSVTNNRNLFSQRNFRRSYMKQNLLQLQALVDFLNEEITKVSIGNATKNIHLFLGFDPLPNSVTGWNAMSSDYFLLDTTDLESGHSKFRPAKERVIEIRKRLVDLM